MGGLLYILQFVYILLHQLVPQGLAQSTSTLQVRLVGGNTPFEGRVEVYYQGTWGTVCDDGWGINEARVVCRQLGYPAASSAWQQAHFGEGSGQIVLDDVDCYGNETSLAACRHSTWYFNNCRHSEDAGVTCSVNSMTPQPTSLSTQPVPWVAVRLVGGNTPYEGRVEVYYQDTWGTVCDDGWGINEARVVCRQLGYPTASSAWQQAHFGEGSGQILLDDVDCYGNETSLAACRHSTWYFNNCGHSEDAGVTCSVNSMTPQPTSLSTQPVPWVAVRLVGGNTLYEGRVEVYYQGTWGTVCDDGWGINEARVVCRQLGYPTASSAWQQAHFGEGSGQILLDDVDCYGNETSLAACRHSTWYFNNCRHSEDAGVTCSVNSMTPQPTSLSTQPVPWVAVRLVGGNTPYEGRVEVYYQDTWGTVCDDGWGINEARVVCRQLGYPTASSAWQQAHFGEGSGQILLDDVDCYGNETSLAACRHSTWYFNNCRHSEDAGVTCSVNSMTPQPTSLSTQPVPWVAVSLVGGNTLYEGRVEVYYHGTWGTVCDDGWGINEARVVCRQLGYPTASSAWQQAHFGEGSGQILLDDVDCYGNETSLAACRHSTWYFNNCGHSEDAGVTCSVNSMTPQPTSLSTQPVLWVPVRLVGGNTLYEGRVEVYYQGTWGTVCDDGWGINEARVVCRQLGYPTASSAWQQAHFGEGSGLILLDDVDCYGYETSLAACRHNSWYFNNCLHSEDAGVTCSVGSATTQSTSLSTRPVPSITDVRLVGSYSPLQGRVEVYFNGQWGTICDDHWDINEAQVVCHQLGYPYAIAAKHQAYFGQGNGVILLDDVYCTGIEQSLLECSHASWGVTDCFHSEDAGVICGYSDIKTTVTSLEVRLVGSIFPYEGRVEIFYQGQWGTVCDDSWDITDANVVCRQLGYDGATNAWEESHFGQGSGPIYLDDVICFGYESSLAECSHRNWLSNDCSHYEDAGVTCHSVTTISDRGLSTGALVTIVAVVLLSLIVIIAIITVCVMHNIRIKRRSQAAAGNSRNIPQSSDIPNSVGFSNPVYTEMSLAHPMPHQPLGPSTGYVPTSYPMQPQSGVYQVPSPYSASAGYAPEPPPGFAPMPFANQPIYSNDAPPPSQAMVSQTPNPNTVLMNMSSEVEAPQEDHAYLYQEFPIPTSVPPEFPSDSMDISGATLNEAEV